MIQKSKDWDYSCSAVEKLDTAIREYHKAVEANDDKEEAAHILCRIYTTHGEGGCSWRKEHSPNMPRARDQRHTLAQMTGSIYWQSSNYLWRSPQYCTPREGRSHRRVGTHGGQAGDGKRDPQKSQELAGLTRQEKRTMMGAGVGVMLGVSVWVGVSVGVGLYSGVSVGVMVTGTSTTRVTSTSRVTSWVYTTVSVSGAQAAPITTKSRMISSFSLTPQS